ncbi:MAG: autotransporter assembly complex family protein [Mesorhizobium sp.]
MARLRTVGAGAVVRLAAVGGLAFAVNIAQPQPASAFKLFGWTLFGNDEEADVADPVKYSVTLDLDETDEQIRKALTNASTLKSDEDRPVSGSLGILSKAQNERELLVAALYQEARYDGTVEITIEGRSLDTLEPDATFDVSRPVPIVVKVVSGQRFTLGEITVNGEAGNLSPARFGLIPGGDASSSAVLRAENEMLRALKEEGRPLAKVADREIVADHNTGTLDVMIALAAGPVAPFGETTVEGTETVDSEFTAYMADIERGKTYSPQDIQDARERLLALGVFGSVTVKEREQLAADGSMPIDIEVSERKHRYFGVGATFSSIDGAGVEGYWGHRNLFGRAEKLRIEGSINRIGEARGVKDLDYKAALLFEKPGVLGPSSKFNFDIKFANEHPDAYDRFVFSTGAGIAYNLTKNQTLSAQVRGEYADITDVFFPNGRKYLLVSTPIEYVVDTRDDKLNAKSGFRLLAGIEPTYDFKSGAAFVKMRGEASVYQSLDQSGRTVLAGRLAAGSIVGASLDDIPADRRFYSGGGGSVRGYGYQDIGPKVVDPATGKLVPTGGRSFAEASLEMRVQVTDTFGVVPFIDAGTVSDSAFPDFKDVRLGAGVGIRYLTPFGPLRIDGAVPLNKRPGDASFGIYAGIGQAF